MVFVRHYFLPKQNAPDFRGANGNRRDASGAEASEAQSLSIQTLTVGSAVATDLPRELLRISQQPLRLAGCTAGKEFHLTPEMIDMLLPACA
jgi:hypothetical protein